jgi:branched-subunit amino acid transport protein
VATGGQTDPARLAAAVMTLLVGVITRSVLGAIIGGAVTLYACLALIG